MGMTISDTEMAQVAAAIASTRSKGSRGKPR